MHEHFTRETGHDRPTSGYFRRDWTAPVDAVADRAREEQRRLALQESLTRQQEREADARSLVAAGRSDVLWERLGRLVPEGGNGADALDARPRLFIRGSDE
jgi:hypothetical protein